MVTQLGVHLIIRFSRLRPPIRERHIPLTRYLFPRTEVYLLLLLQNFNYIFLLDTEVLLTQTRIRVHQRLLVGIVETHLRIIDRLELN